MKTYSQTTAQVQRNWHLIDVKDQVLGRVATQIAQKLIGKHKPTYTPHIDAGDYVVVINAAQVVLTRNKAEQKMYRSHSGYPGGFKEVSFKKMIIEHPERVIQSAVNNMLPKNKLRADRMARLKVYAGETHPHQAQIDYKSKSEKK